MTSIVGLQQNKPAQLVVKVSPRTDYNSNHGVERLRCFVFQDKSAVILHMSSFLALSAPQCVLLTESYTTPLFIQMHYTH